MRASRRSEGEGDGARRALKAERTGACGAADAERALQRGAGRAAVRGRPKRLQRRAGHVKQAGRREREGQLGRGQEEEGGKGPANSCAGLKREEMKFFQVKIPFLFLVFKSKFKCKPNANSNRVLNILFNSNKSEQILVSFQK